MPTISITNSEMAKSVTDSSEKSSNEGGEKFFNWKDYYGDDELGKLVACL